MKILCLCDLCCTMAATIKEEKEEVKELPTVSNEAVVTKWDGMAKWYAGMANQFMAPTAASLVPQLQLNRKSNDDDTFRFLEVAVGDGFNSVRIIKELIDSKPKGFEYYGIDISSEMINYTNKTIKDDILLSTFLKNADNSDKYKIDISVQNGEDLKKYKDETFDRYLASLCLMLTGNASNMICESYRILKPNGISAWSIWGDKNKGLVFESLGPILKPIKKELGVEVETSGYAGRSNYYLADDMENTVKLFKSVGYKTVFYWNVDVPFPVNTAKQWSDYYQTGPAFVGLLGKCKDDEQKQKIKKMLADGMEARFNEFVIDQNKAITHNNICIIAIK